MNASAERVLAPLEQMRRSVLRALIREPRLRAVLVRREQRVPLLLSLHASVAFTFALLAPALSLVLTPLVLGVPHVAADLRYLVLRRGLAHWWCAAIAAFSLMLIGLRLAWHARWIVLPPTAAEHAIGSGWLLLAALVGAWAAGFGKRALATILGALVVGGSAITMPVVFRNVFVHAHNLVAIVIWLALFRRAARLTWLPVVLVTFAAVGLGSGVFLPVTLRYGVIEFGGVHLFAAADWLAPGIADERALNLTIVFAFLQSVHYAIWLVAIPQDDARAQGSPSLRMKCRALSRDFGGAGLVGVVAVTLLVGACGYGAAELTRSVYLSLATFHTWLELALLAYFGARGGLPPMAAAS